jgi:hypothetical protein
MITAERLREVLRYSPIVGVFEWRIAGRRIRPGYLAGCASKTSGYIKICIDRKQYSGQNLAWLYMTGKWPEVVIDHKDGDRSNNAFNNLRPATRAQNAANARRAAHNKSGEKGVFFCNTSRRWKAQIKTGGSIAFSKMYKTLDEAVAGIREAREKLLGEFANHGIHGYEKEEMESVDFNQSNDHYQPHPAAIAGQVVIQSLARD